MSKLGQSRCVVYLLVLDWVFLLLNVEVLVLAFALNENFLRSKILM